MRSETSSSVRGYGGAQLQTANHHELHSDRVGGALGAAHPRCGGVVESAHAAWPAGWLWATQSLTHSPEI
jgi:hypothetical protein